MSEYKIVIDYRMFARELCLVHQEFSDLLGLKNTLYFLWFTLL